MTRETHELDAFPKDVYLAMMVGLRDYVERNGFPGVILGLSGGIDSALSAAVAVDALGPDKVWGVMLPSKYTSGESLEDARECARLLGCRHDVVTIAPAVGAVDEMLPQMSGLAAENVQARLRMFTGIVTDVGSVRSVEQRGDLRLTIATGYDLATVDLGASIACSGVCLTVVDKGDDWFAVDVSAETVSRTASGLWR